MAIYNDYYDFSLFSIAFCGVRCTWLWPEPVFGLSEGMGYTNYLPARRFDDIGSHLIETESTLSLFFSEI